MGTIEDGNKYLMNTYARFPVAFVRGEGAKLWDEDGKEYTDFLAGIAVVNLGHAHPAVAAAIAHQAGRIMHTSNLFHIRPQADLARWLATHSFADRVFFCNSGTEANEAALKLARRWAKDHKSGAFEIIAMEESFHGRTLFSLSVTGQTRFHQGFEPLVPGVVTVPYDDPAAVARAINPRTAAVIVEPVQGESGVRVPRDSYLKELRKICDDSGVLLIFDEVQTGMGRTGTMFAYESSGIAPDIMTLAKALGNGFPIGAMLATERVAQAFVPGTHAATFGGNFLACAAALATVREIGDPAFLQKVRETGAYFKERLQELAADHDAVMEVRGKGMLLALALDRPARPVVDYCLQHGMIINCTAESVLRFAPPLIISRQEIDALIPVLDQALKHLAGA
ncbi:MAG TPA: acetylornithine transaminase [bacterium]|nr:acetylornithine transaminase [bacterium]